MQTSGNTILITGGGSGIGRGLAEAFQAAGNQVIISGRRKQVLEETTAANPGMKSATLNIDSSDDIRRFAAEVQKDFPALNVVIHNAGIMRNERLTDGTTEDAEAIIATNLLGPIRLTAELMPLLLKQPHAAILTVSSGLAFVPLFMTPTYCATKAAMHSWTESLRYQLRDTAVQVVEIIPPYVQTELSGERQKNDPMAMPLKDYIAETVNLIQTQPNAQEILVERVKAMRYAEKSGSYEGFFKQMNDHFAQVRANEL